MTAPTHEEMRTTIRAHVNPAWDATLEAALKYIDEAEATERERDELRAKVAEARAELLAEQEAARKVYGFDGDKARAEAIARRTSKLTTAPVSARHALIDSWWELLSAGLPNVMAAHLDYASDEEPDQLAEAYASQNLARDGWPLTEYGQGLVDNIEQLEKKASDDEAAGRNEP